MPLPLTRQELIEYVKRRLGAPVINIDVSPEQFEDRIDDALAFFSAYHQDATVRTFLKHQITASTLTFPVASSGTFQKDEKVVGTTSGRTATVLEVMDATTLKFQYADEQSRLTGLTPGESITGVSSGATAVVGTITLGDLDNHYIPVSPEVMSVIRMVPIGFGGGRGSIFSWDYQYILNDLRMLATGNVQGYVLQMSYMEMLHDLFVGDTLIRFSRHENKLYLDIDWRKDVGRDEYVVAEVLQILNPNQHISIWSDRFLRNYATALVQKQWGLNLLKFQGVQMPGNITLNGQAIYDLGSTEVQKLEEEIALKFEEPLGFFVG